MNMPGHGDNRPPLLGRAIVTLAGWLAPAPVREERLAHWRANLRDLQVLLERCEAGLLDRLEMWRACREILTEALWLRVDRDAIRRTARGAACLLACGALALLALGVASGGFKDVRSLFHRPLLRDPGQLVAIRYSGMVDERAGVPPALVPLWRAKTTQLSGLAGFVHAPRGPLAWVTRDFFDVLGVKPAAGRFFHPDDREAAVLSHEAWLARFGAAQPSGQSLEIYGRTFTVVGVLPKDFWSISPAIEIYTPLDLEPQPARLPYLIGAVGRLSRHGTPDAVRLELFDIATAAKIALPRYPEVRTFGAVPARAFTGYLLGLAFALAIAAALVVRGGPFPVRRGWRPLAFFFAKAALAIAIPWTAWVEGAAWIHAAWPEQTGRPEVGLALLFSAFLASCSCALWWSFLDQRRRCPVCLQRLTMPVRLGSWGSVLDPAATEMLCDSGHGMLCVPETEEGAPDHWTRLDSSWRDLFRK
jgi:hypothetical protein